jgi:predicted lipoprotein with Yx(FWY)xxD motif
VKTSSILFGVIAAATAITACGSDAATTSPTAAPGATATQAATAAPDPYGDPTTAAVNTVAPAAPAPDTATPSAPAGDAVVVVSDNALGQILTDGSGMVLYGFTADVDGTPTCNGGCAGAWPPVVVDAGFDVSTLPASGAFTVVDRADGTKQLKSGKWPLYYFAGDTAAGQTNGQGSGDVWFVVAPDGSLIK